MKTPRGQTSKKTIVAALAGALTALPACAFEMPKGTQYECQKDSDCAEFRACNPVTFTCDLQAPPPDELVIAGPFDCTMDKAEQYSAVSLSAKWPETVDGNYTIPASDGIRLAHKCDSFPDPDDPTIAWFWFFSGRQENQTFQMLGFYQFAMIVPLATTEVGTRTVSSELTGLMFCETYPRDNSGNTYPDDPYVDGTLKGCFNLFDVPTLQLSVARRSGQEVVGYVNGALIPHVYEYTGGAQ
jgi:hypothetical protein